MWGFNQSGPHPTTPQPNNSFSPNFTWATKKSWLVGSYIYIAGCLGYIGNHTTSTRNPIKQPTFHGKSPGSVFQPRLKKFTKKWQERQDVALVVLRPYGYLTKRLTYRWGGRTKQFHVGWLAVPRGWGEWPIQCEIIRYLFCHCWYTWHIYKLISPLKVCKMTMYWPDVGWILQIQMLPKGIQMYMTLLGLLFSRSSWSESKADQSLPHS